MNVVLTSQQRQALAEIKRWLRSGRKPFFYLAGYAGTGKITLVKEVARFKKNVKFAAYTGKAAHVMHQKGCEGACTIHQLIYTPATETRCVAKSPCAEPPCREHCRYARQRFVGQTLKIEGDVCNADLIVVDEVSMVGREIARDLLSFEVPILVLGDNAQLQPIGEGAGYFTRREPDFQLTEIHRQAHDSPIIKLATRARKGLPLKHGQHGDSVVMRGLDTANLLHSDQVICGTHRMREYLNRTIREALGFEGDLPQVGERVVCLRNNHQKGLRNGSLWQVLEIAKLRDGFVGMTVKDENGVTAEVISPEAGFTSRDGSGADLHGQPFAFGYALTCHKAQGSQWDAVMVVDESRYFSEPRKWLYTAITRAAEAVAVVELR